MLNEDVLCNIYIERYACLPLYIRIVYLIFHGMYFIDHWFEHRIKQ